MRAGPIVRAQRASDGGRRPLKLDVRSRPAVALSELESARVRKTVGAFVEGRRPPPHLRQKVDLAFRVSGQSVEIFEVRALWDDKTKRIEQPVAKATYNKGKKTWKVYWQRADLKWHAYQPKPEVASLEEFIAVVEDDAHACFFG